MLKPFERLKAVSVLLAAFLLSTSVGWAQYGGNASSSSSSGSANLTPANYAPQVLEPQAPGSGGANSKQAAAAPKSGQSSPSTQAKPSLQVKQQVYTRVPVRARL